MSELNLAQFAGLAFDFDGTLADSVSTHTEARTVAFREMASLTGDDRFLSISPQIQHEAHRHGSNPTAIIGWTLQAVGIVSEITDPLVATAVELKKQAYLELCQRGLRPIPFALDFVRQAALCTSGRSGITTTAHLIEVTPFLAKHHLEDVIDDTKLVTFEDVGPNHMKPDPTAYMVTLQRFGLEGESSRLLVFEDTPGGISSAKAAGTTVVAVCTTHEREELEAAGSDYIFESFEDLLRAGKHE